ncbi:aminoacyl-tRNA deacylase [Solemya pervernicosa gill symbiont]|uniref:Cys-tRNA(Pro)/Cys-tRNA(Cys) deacylase n=1 Tax=Solemya pervernicosa gill symbiont TaxID=642797 RepID=A0A1T2L2N9_9GAMM|nr:Cys-tRNA(Pro) deacylase [Solemya pervernicosa gill symbiont]OOZ39300.1 aminoacyl-tRNA deacylase [Solemya pervernicosa gill symbiont]
MTPAINIAKDAKNAFTIHEYQHDPKHESFGLEAAEKLGVDQQRVFKTLVVKLDNCDLAIGVLPVSTLLSMKTVAKSLGAKRAEMASQSDAERATGYLLGGISPLGQKRRLKSVIDQSAQQYQTIYVSAGRRGLEIELAPNDLCRLASASFAAITQ